MTILVTGPTGRTGGAVVRELLAAGQPVRALVRTPERADDLRGLDVQVAVGDFGQPETLDDALRGVRAAYLVSPASEQQVSWEVAFVDAVARAADRPHVIKVASLGYQSTGGRFGANHRAVVEQLAVAQVSHTVLAANGFLQGLLATAAVVARAGVLAVPASECAISFVDARDVGAVAAVLLAEALAGTPSHVGATLDVTGPEPLTHAQIAKRMSAALGQDVRYDDVSYDVWRENLVGSGVPAWAADGLIELYEMLYRPGHAAAVSDVVPRVLGRPARSLDDFLRDHLAAFRQL